MTTRGELKSGTMLDGLVWIDDRLSGIVMQQSSVTAGTEAGTEGESEAGTGTSETGSEEGEGKEETEAGEAGTGESETETEDKTATTTATTPKADWRDKQIAKGHARQKELQARLAEAERERDELRSGRGQSGLTQADVDRLASEKAAQLASEQTFTKDVQNLAADGKAAFPDWDSRVTSLAQLVDQNDPASVNSYAAFIGAALETGEAAKIIHTLAGDLDEAQRILELSPVKMGIELGKLALREPSEPSKAPRPIRPVNGSAASHSEIRPDDPDRADTLSTAEWMRRRNAQENAARKRA